MKVIDCRQLFMRKIAERAPARMPLPGTPAVEGRALDDRELEMPGMYIVNEANRLHKRSARLRDEAEQMLERLKKLTDEK